MRIFLTKRETFLSAGVLYTILIIIPEPTARSAVPGVSPGRGLLIPHGYLHPGKNEHSEVLRSVKFINNRGRMAMVHGWTSH